MITGCKVGNSQPAPEVFVVFTVDAMDSKFG